MSITNNKQNPFGSNENLTPIFESSDRYESTKNHALQTFLKTQTQKPKPIIKPTFNLTNFMSFNFTHFTKFSIAGIAVFTLLAGGLSAQALAPDTLKPTQLAQSIKDKYFSANKQSDGDPGVALVPDENNDVVKLSSCGFALKFPKISKNKLSRINETNSNEVSYIELNIGTRVSIQCSDVMDDSLFEKENVKVSTLVNSGYLREKTGWFIANEKVTSIKNWITNVGKTIRIIYNKKLIYINISEDDSVLSSIQLQDLDGVDNKFSLNEKSFIDSNICNQRLKIIYKDSPDVSYTSTILQENSTININQITKDIIEIGTPQSYTVNISCFEPKENDWRSRLNVNPKKYELVDNISFLTQNFKNRVEKNVYKDSFTPNTWYIQHEGYVYIINYVRPDIIANKLAINIDLK
jgi:hypothetical protein